MALLLRTVVTTSKLLPKLPHFHLHLQHHNHRHITTIRCHKSTFPKNIPSNDPYRNPYLKEGPVQAMETKRGKNGMMIVRIDMPGVDEESLKIWVDEDSVHFYGESELRLEYNYRGRVYDGTININPEIYSIDGLKTEIHNGILWLVVPPKPQKEPSGRAVRTASAMNLVSRPLKKKEEILLCASSFYAETPKWLEPKKSNEEEKVFGPRMFESDDGEDKEREYEDDME